MPVCRYFGVSDVNLVCPTRFLSKCNLLISSHTPSFFSLFLNTTSLAPSHSLALELSRPCSIPLSAFSNDLSLSETPCRLGYAFLFSSFPAHPCSLPLLYPSICFSNDLFLSETPCRLGYAFLFYSFQPILVLFPILIYCHVKQ